MQELQDRIRKEGKVLPGNIIKVDGFLNHRVDVKLMEAIADEFAKFFDTGDITMVLTAEASGIALATICAQRSVSERDFFLYLQEEGHPDPQQGVADEQRQGADCGRLHGERRSGPRPVRPGGPGGGRAEGNRHRRREGVPGRRRPAAGDGAQLSRVGDY